MFVIKCMNAGEREIYIWKFDYSKFILMVSAFLISLKLEMNRFPTFRSLWFCGLVFSMPSPIPLFYFVSLGQLLKLISQVSTSFAEFAAVFSLHFCVRLTVYQFVWVQKRHINSNTMKKGINVIACSHLDSFLHFDFNECLLYVNTAQIRTIRCVETNHGGKPWYYSPLHILKLHLCRTIYEHINAGRRAFNHLSYIYIHLLELREKVMSY